MPDKIPQKPLRNPSKAEKEAYREKQERYQGMDMEPKSAREIKADKSKNLLSRETDEEIRLSGSKSQQYFKDDRGLGSPASYDDFSEESEP